MTHDLFASFTCILCVPSSRLQLLRFAPFLHAAFDRPKVFFFPGLRLSEPMAMGLNEIEFLARTLFALCRALLRKLPAESRRLVFRKVATVSFEL